MKQILKDRIGSLDGILYALMDEVADFEVSQPAKRTPKMSSRLWWI